jgi:flavin-dependent dehydrogenase
MANVLLTLNVRCVRDYSYRSKRYYGNHWAIVGDSAGFIDPIFSTGLQVAFNSAYALIDPLNEPEQARWKGQMLFGDLRKENVLADLQMGLSRNYDKIFHKRFKQRQRVTSETLGQLEADET